MNSRRAIFRLKLAIEADAKIGHGSRALGLRVCSYIYNHPQHRHTPDEAFPLPWTLCSELGFGMSKRQAYYSLKELHERGHIKHAGAFGCPAKAHFQLCIPAESVTGRGAVFCTPSSAKNCTARGAKNSSPRGAMKRSPLISNSLREEIVKPMEENSSLRSEGTKGEFNGSPTARKMTNAEAMQLWKTAKSKKGLA